MNHPDTWTQGWNMTFGIGPHRLVVVVLGAVALFMMCAQAARAEDDPPPTTTPATAVVTNAPTPAPSATLARHDDDDDHGHGHKPKKPREPRQPRAPRFPHSDPPAPRPSRTVVPRVTVAPVTSPPPTAPRVTTTTERLWHGPPVDPPGFMQFETTSTSTTTVPYFAPARVAAKPMPPAFDGRDYGLLGALGAVFVGSLVAIGLLRRNSRQVA